MSEEFRIDEMELEEINGGITRPVKNTSAGYANVRTAPGLKSGILGRVSNGKKVSTIGAPVVKDGYKWYPIMTNKGKGWIAGSLIGL
ncbi:MAG: SH3 domain-containing protein [Lachnospiraceae bacterium]|nr:SH3 domain-containing protein [Lachnospiraceae bacterium]